MAARPGHVVIVGAGFGGLYAARALRRANVRITVIDRQNHHLFQPLLYEVATAALSPAYIAAPIRTILSRQRNAQVILGEAVAVDAAQRRVRLTDGDIGYDFLVLAAGASHSYFGRDEWARFAPGLKTLADATEIRTRFLLAFEAAEREADEAARRAKLTFVIVGGGPTGVELAGTMIELARRGIPRDFRMIDTRTVRVILVEAGERLLGTFPPDLSDRARRDLEAMGVEVRLNHRVTEIDDSGVIIGGEGDSLGNAGERIDAENVIWAAGVRASSLGASLDVPVDAAGRVIVRDDLSIPDHPEVFVIGDLAAAKDARSGGNVPGIAPAAIQMGRYVARQIARETSPRGRTSSGRKPFRYVDKGMIATIGRARAVGVVFGLHVRGMLAWLLWAGVHIMYLIGFRNRLIVIVQWAWAYLVFRRGARLISGTPQMDLRRPRSDEL